MHPYAQVPRTAYSGPLPEGAHRGNAGALPCYQAPRWTLAQDGSGPGGFGGLGCGPCAAAAATPRLTSVQGTSHPRASRAEISISLHDEQGRPLNGRIHLYGANNFLMTTSEDRTRSSFRSGVTTRSWRSPAGPRGPSPFSLVQD